MSVKICCLITTLLYAVWTWSSRATPPSPEPIYLNRSIAFGWLSCIDYGVFHWQQLSIYVFQCVNMRMELYYYYKRFPPIHASVMSSLNGYKRPNNWLYCPIGHMQIFVCTTGIVVYLLASFIVPVSNHFLLLRLLVYHGSFQFDPSWYYLICDWTMPFVSCPCLGGNMWQIVIIYSLILCSVANSYHCFIQCGIPVCVPRFNIIGNKGNYRNSIQLDRLISFDQLMNNSMLIRASSQNLLGLLSFSSFPRPGYVWGEWVLLCSSCHRSIRLPRYHHEPMFDEHFII